MADDEAENILTRQKTVGRGSSCEQCNRYYGWGRQMQQGVLAEPEQT
jgi:hypothetical protein